MNKQQILDAIEQYITTNGLQEITGQVMNVILTSIATIIPDDTMLTSSFGGIVTPASNIVVTPGHQKWFFANPGTYTNFGNFTFDSENLNIISYNGVDWQKYEILLPSNNAKKVFNKSDDTFPSTMRATAEYLGTVPTNLPPIGVSLLGGATVEIGGAGAQGNLISNTLCKAEKDVVIKSIITNFSVAGNFKIAVTSIDNVIIYTSPIEYTAGIGSQTTILPDVPLKKGQIAWLMCLDSSTGVIKYSASGASGNNFLQRPINTGNVVYGGSGSYYSIYFNIVSDYPTGILSTYISRSESEGYKNIDPLETFGSAAFSNAIGNQPAIAYYILKIPFTVSKTIQKLNFSSSAGTMTFVIGTLDQANKFIEERSFQVTTVSGANSIVVDQELKVGQYIGVKTPGLMPNFNTALVNDYLWSTESSYTAPLNPSTTYNLGVSIEVRTRLSNPNALAHMSDINALDAKIVNIQVSNIWKSPDGTNWKVGVSNTGTFTAQAVGKYSKILHFGNSMLRHAITSYWWGDWGMAAKTRADDYAHRFLTKIKVGNPSAQSWEHNIAEWEANPTGYNKSLLDPILTAEVYDLVVIRIGENATSTPAATYKTAFRELIIYIQTKVPTARIIIGGMFWINGGLENAMRDIAIEKGLTFAPMTGLDIPANKSFIGDVVQGDDGQSRTVDNAGVANHPNNNGMEGIATNLYLAANS